MKQTSANLALFCYNFIMTLKELRKSKKITQQEASQICGIPLRTYKRLETEEKYFSGAKYRICFSLISSYMVKNNNTKISNVLVIGAGYVGLSVGIMLSEKHKVTLVDIDEIKIDKINNHVSPIKDKEMEEWLNNKKLNIKAVKPSSDNYKNQDYIFIALPTDYDEENKKYKMDIITNTIKDIRKVNKSVLIIIKSTISPGYTDSFKDKNIIFCPEFLKEGTALNDSLYPARIIIGSSFENRKINQFAALLRNSIRNNAPIIMMNAKEAEATKLIANTYLAMRVSFFNEIDSFLEENGLNAEKVITGVSLDPRVGDFYNNPSFGYGGYCLPKDTQVMTNIISKQNNNELITAISKSNISRKKHIAQEIIRFAKKIAGRDKNITIGVYSLASKQGSDNSRNAAILDVINYLKEAGFAVLLYENDMSFDYFASHSDVIIANRYKNELDQVRFKLYTRDIFKNN